MPFFLPDIKQLQQAVGISVCDLGKRFGIDRQFLQELATCFELAEWVVN